MHTYHTLQLRLQNASSVQHQSAATQMRSCATGKIHNRRSNIFRVSQPPVGVCLCQTVSASTQLHQSVCHFGGEEARRNVVDQNTLRAQLEGQITSEMQDGCLGGRVSVSALLAQSANTNTGDGTGNDYAGGRFDRTCFAEEWREPVIVMSVHYPFERITQRHTSVRRQTRS